MSDELKKFTDEEKITIEMIVNKLSEVLVHELNEHFKNINISYGACLRVMNSLFVVVNESYIEEVHEFLNEGKVDGDKDQVIKILNKILDKCLNEYKHSISYLKDFIKKEINKG